MNPRHPKTRLLETLVFGSLLIGISIPRVHAQGRLQKTADTETRPRPGMKGTSDDQESVGIRRKLASIIIPNVEFHATTLGDAVEYLRQESRRLDTDPDADARGVNILLKLPATAAHTAGPLPNLDIPGLPAGAASVSASPLPTANSRVTLTLSRIPLLEALKYIASQAGLKVRVEPYAVSLVPLAEDTDALITAVFRVSPTFIDNKSTGSGTTALDHAATSAQ